MPTSLSVSEVKTRAVRLAFVFLVCLAVVGCAIAMMGWQPTSFLMMALVIMVGVLLTVQLTRTLLRMHEQSTVIREAARQAEEHYVAVLRRVVRFSEARDRYTRGRGERIGQLAETIARRIGLGEEVSKMLNVAGQLHDIGMLAVSEQMLNKRSRLGVEDFRTVQRHTEVSFEVLAPLGMLDPVLPAIRHHHERMNGTGYPGGLAGDQIPVEARVLAVADAYDAMTHDRPHRSAMMPLEALTELRRCCPAGYDERCVNALAEILNLTEMEAAAAKPVERRLAMQVATA